MVCTAWRRALLQEPFLRLSLADSEGLFEWMEARRPTVLSLVLDGWGSNAFDNLRSAISSGCGNGRGNGSAGEAAAWKARLSKALATLGKVCVESHVCYGA